MLSASMRSPLCYLAASRKGVAVEKPEDPKAALKELVRAFTKHANAGIKVRVFDFPGSDGLFMVVLSSLSYATSP